MKLWYKFSKGEADGDRSMRELLGGKGANLAEMSKLGVPVPPGLARAGVGTVTGKAMIRQNRPDVEAEIDFVREHSTLAARAATGHEEDRAHHDAGDGLR